MRCVWTAKELWRGARGRITVSWGRNPNFRWKESSRYGYAFRSFPDREVNSPSKRTSTLNSIRGETRNIFSILKEWRQSAFVRKRLELRCHRVVSNKGSKIWRWRRSIWNSIDEWGRNDWRRHLIRIGWCYRTVSRRGGRRWGARRVHQVSNNEKSKNLVNE
jgi:hypothetical protein